MGKALASQRFSHPLLGRVRSRLFQPFLRQVMAGFILFGNAAIAQEYRYHLLDQDKQPLVDAVVEFEGSAEADSSAVTSVAVMDQVNYQFKPHVLAIMRGQSVVFPNSDQVRHHVYSFSPEKVFEIKLFKGLAENPVKFDVAGLVTLGCNIHDDMLGYIYIAKSNCFAKSDAAGDVSLQCSSKPKQASIWHQRLSLDGKARIDVAIPTPGQILEQTIHTRPVPASDKTDDNSLNRLRPAAD